SGAYDGICHEHLCYYDVTSFYKVCSESGLDVRWWSENECNGGSLRFYVTHGNCPAMPVGISTQDDLKAFVARVQASRHQLDQYLTQGLREGKNVHLLGASTKLNTVLQYVGGLERSPYFASDRDPRKWGRRTPGTNIPIIAEEESRAMNPDVYLVGPW